MATSPPVTFSFSDWVGYFPEFANVGDVLGASYFARATASIVANSTSHPAYPDGQLPILIYLATSHVAWLNCPKDANGNPSQTGAPASPLVGRVSTASEGSVSVSTDFAVDGGASAQERYLSQTRYGVELWTALAPYRTARYVARPTIVRGGRFLSPWYNPFR